MNPDKFGFYPIKNDPLNRKVAWGLLKGSGAKTVVLFHHSDTVDTEDYGRLKSLAHSPFELTEKLRDGKIKVDKETQTDLDTGDWLFGRGVADMKAELLFI